MIKINKNPNNKLLSSYLRGDFAAFSQHIEDGENINCLNHERHSLISTVIRNSYNIENNKEFFDLLISKGVSLKQIGWEGDLLTVCVLYQNDIYYGKKLLENKIDKNSLGIVCYPEKEYGGCLKLQFGPPIFEAIKCMRMDYVKLLLENNVDMEMIDHQGKSILHSFVDANIHGEYKEDNKKVFAQKMLGVLLDNDADVTCRDDRGCDIVNLIALYDKGHLLEVLFKKGKNINIDSRDEGGTTALMKSLLRSDEVSKSTKLLIKNKANLNIYNLQGKNALMRCVDFSNVKSFEYLIKSGADVLLVNKNKDTILHYICERAGSVCDIREPWEASHVYDNREKYCDAILRKHPELLTQKNSEGLTPIDVLKQSERYASGDECFLNKYKVKTKDNFNSLEN